ncbi:MAG: hypothetical protein ACTSU5_09885 [Promethearchaeota archaeon]
MNLSLEDFPWFSMVNQARVEALLSAYNYKPTEDDYVIACDVIETVYGKDAVPSMEAEEVEDNVAASIAAQLEHEKARRASHPADAPSTSGDALGLPKISTKVIENLFVPEGLDPETRREVEEMEQRAAKEIREEFFEDEE